MDGTHETPVEKQKVTLLQAFLSKSGYKSTDVLVTNDRLRTVVTSNGGKYQVTKNGGIRILKGPNYPKFVAPTAE